MKLINIANEFRSIYLFCRDDAGKLNIKTINSFFPYYYILDDDGSYLSFTGEPLRKVIVSAPHEIAQNRTDSSYEADIQLTKRYLIDKIDKLEKTKIKYSFIDIEILTDEKPNVQIANKPVSCISVYNSFTDEIKTFFLKDYDSDEREMLEDFVVYMKSEAFDLWLSWFVDFDYDYLFHRYHLLTGEVFPEAISPIGKSRYGKKDVYYPAGISIVDYLEWFKKITMNKELQYTLDYIAQKHLGKGKVHSKVDFSKLTDEIKERNIEDVTIMKQLEEKKQLIPYFDEIRRMSKVEWEDLNFNSRILDMLLLSEAKNQKVVLPMKPDERRGTLADKPDFTGAYRDILESGAFFDVGAYDISEAYPSMIINFALDIANLKSEKEENTLPITIKNMDRDENKNLQYNKDHSLKTIVGNTHYYIQDNTKLLSTVTKKLLTLKRKIKNQLKECKLDSQEYIDTKQSYDAIKTIVNSCFTPDTNIITTEGIKNIKDIKIGDKVYNVNPITLKVEEDEIIDTQKLNYNGDIYNYKNDLTNLKITNDHKFLVQNKRTQKNKFESVKELYKQSGKYYTIPSIQPRIIDSSTIITLLNILQKNDGKIWMRTKNMYKIRKTKIFPFKKKLTKRNNHHTWYICNAKEITEKKLLSFYKADWKIYGEIRPKTKLSPIIFSKYHFIQLLGWFISEGSIYKSKMKQYEKTKRDISTVISISQYDKQNREEIEDLLKNCDFDINWKNNKGLSFCSEVLYYYFKDNCGNNSFNKKIPKFIFKERYNIISLFWNTLYKGDGNKREKRYNTNSWQLTQDLLNLLILMGNNSVRYYKDKNTYRIVWSNTNKSINNKQIKTEKYNGFVYCCTTKKNHNLFAGRKGNFSLTGQCYGVFGNRFFRLFSEEIAETTTFLVRDFLDYVVTALYKKGHKVLYVDTDSVMIDNHKEDISNLLNDLAIKWAKEKYDKDNISLNFGFEGVFESILLCTKCRYKGYLKTPKGIEPITKGLEIKRKDSTIYMKEFQEILIDKIIKLRQSKELIFKWIRSEINNFKNQSLQDISCPCKLGMKPEEYKNVPIFLRALNNTKDYTKKVGEAFYYIYVKPIEEPKIKTIIKDKGNLGRDDIVLEKNITRKEGIEYAKKEWEVPTYLSKNISVVHKKEQPKNVLAFDEDNFNHIEKSMIDWKMMLERNILKKLVTIFEAMRWDLEGFLNEEKTK